MKNTPIIISNIGTAPLNLTDINVQGAGSADFSMDFGTCGSIFPSMILPGGSCTITVNLKQSVSYETRYAELQINSNDPSTQTTAIPIVGIRQSPFPVSSLPVDPITMYSDPTTINTLYIAGNNYNGSGVFKSINGGETWNKISNGIAHDSYGSDPYINTFAMHPNNNLVLFVSTLSGTYRSLDGGNSWILIDDLSTASVTKFAFAPSSPSTIYATGSSGLYRSTDSGVNWVILGSLPLNSKETTLTVDPVSADTLYIGRISTYVDYNYVYGVYKSNDCGLTWLSSGNNGLPSNWSSIDKLMIISTTFYAIVSDRLYKSIDNGQNWEEFRINGNSYGWNIFPDPSSVKTMYATTNYYGYSKGIYKTIDGGATWFYLDDTRGLYPYNKEYLAVTPLDNSLYTTGSGYIYKLSAINQPPSNYSLDIVRNGSGSGSVQYSGFEMINKNYISPTTCNSTGPCGGSYQVSSILIHPQPETGSIFAGWSGCDKEIGTECQVNLVSPQTVTATFIRDPKPLTAIASPPGGTYTSSPMVTLGASKDATIYYTLDGSIPTASSARYTEPIYLGWPATLKFIAIDPFGTASAIFTETYATSGRTLTVTPSGSGRGTINSIEPESGLITCSNPHQTGDTCSTWLPSGSNVVLSASPDTSSVATWTGCTSTAFNTCNVTLTSDTFVNAIFNLVMPVRIYGSEPLIEDISLSSVYAHAVNGDVIQARDLSFDEHLILNYPKNVSITGGYSLDYLTRPGYTLVRGGMTVRQGSVIVDHLVIQ